LNGQRSIDHIKQHFQLICIDHQDLCAGSETAAQDIQTSSSEATLPTNVRTVITEHEVVIGSQESV